MKSFVIAALVGVISGHKLEENESKRHGHHHLNSHHKHHKTHHKHYEEDPDDEWDTGISTMQVHSHKALTVKGPEAEYEKEIKGIKDSVKSAIKKQGAMEQMHAEHHKKSLAK